MIPLKVLYSAIRAPFFSKQGFGLGEHHFYDAKRIQCTCSYTDKNGVRLWPHKYEIDSEKAFRVGERWEKGHLLIIPIKEFDVVKNDNSD